MNPRREPHSAGKACLRQINSLRGFGPAGSRELEKAKTLGTKNKAVDAVYRQRPCQPRTLKSAHAIR